jgi:RNA polymerase subunit RPABC4/transcription elongation factor Spt4
MRRDSQFPYEDAAEEATVTGWVCKTCRRFWGTDERMARWCCANSIACKKCDGRIDDSYTVCRSCRDAEKHARWGKYQAVDWDGVTPLCVYDSDKFLFSADDLASWLDDRGEIPLDDVRLVLCQRVEYREFEVSDFISDSLPDNYDYELDDQKINDAVNDWIRDNAPASWTPSNVRVSPESLRKHLHESYWTTRQMKP